jgi:hypothetical protein
MGDKWERLKNLSENEIGGLSISPPSDLPWVIYTIVQKIKELEEKDGRESSI